MCVEAGHSHKTVMQRKNHDLPLIIFEISERNGLRDKICDFLRKHGLGCERAISGDSAEFKKRRAERPLAVSPFPSPTTFHNFSYSLVEKGRGKEKQKGR